MTLYDEEHPSNCICPECQDENWYEIHQDVSDAVEDDICGHPCEEYFEFGSCRCTGYECAWEDDDESEAA